MESRATSIYLFIVAFLTSTCTAIPAPVPAQLFVTPVAVDKIATLAGNVKAKPVNGVYTQCAKAGDIALTFDDGPYRYQEELLATLDQANAIGSFFVNGKNWDCIYDQAESLRAAFDKGHVIGSHTWTHPDISMITSQSLHDELTKIEVALKKILGIKPKFFRPPYGSYNQAALEVLESRGYSTIMWSMDSGDSARQPAAVSISKYEQQAAKYPSPDITLNHETYRSTVDNVMPKAVKLLNQAGYKLVSLAQCLGLEPYEHVGGRTERDESWTC